MTAEQIIKRVYKRTTPVDGSCQTDKDPLEDQFNMMKEKEFDLYRKKYDLEAQIKSQSSEITKFKHQISDLENRLMRENIENDQLIQKLRKVTNKDSEIQKDQDTITRLEYQIKQQKDLLQSKDLQIQTLTRREKRVQYETDQILKKFEEMMKNAKVLEGEVRVKEVMVQRLKKNLR